MAVPGEGREVFPEGIELPGGSPVPPFPDDIGAKVAGSVVGADDVAWVDMPLFCVYGLCENWLDCEAVVDGS